MALAPSIVTVPELFALGEGAAGFDYRRSPKLVVDSAAAGGVDSAVVIHRGAVVQSPVVVQGSVIGQDGATLVGKQGAIHVVHRRSGAIH